MHGIIYKATGPDGRVYIGQTVRTLARRKSQHAFMARVKDKRTAFQLAILEHGGVNAFQWEQIDTAESKEGLDQKEKHWIKKLKADNPAKGYNQNDGGVRYKASAETRRKISEAVQRGLDDLTGQRFGRLIVVSLNERRSHRQRCWNCVCDCGNSVIVTGNHLKKGNTKGCGCLRGNSKKHGKYKTRLYRIWANMLSRCNNKNQQNYRWYDGKGIVVCPEWKDFSVFYEWAMSHGYADNLTIYRIDSDKNYTPENCQWIARSENTRKSRSKKADFLSA